MTLREYHNVDVALILQQNGRFFTYRSIHLESWLPLIKEIVREPQLLSLLESRQKLLIVSLKIISVTTSKDIFHLAGSNSKGFLLQLSALTNQNMGLGLRQRIDKLFDFNCSFEGSLLETSQSEYKIEYNLFELL